eukprot:4180329-Alexandrium_andersonii.AAC.1
MAKAPTVEGTQERAYNDPSLRRMLWALAVGTAQDGAQTAIGTRHAGRTHFKANCTGRSETADTYMNSIH